MKKASLIILLLIVLLVPIIMLSGCGNDGGNQNESRCEYWYWACGERVSIVWEPRLRTIVLQEGEHAGRRVVYITGHMENTSGQVLGRTRLDFEILYRDGTALTSVFAIEYTLPRYGLRQFFTNSAFVTDVQYKELTDGQGLLRTDAIRVVSGLN